ncbi:hypothetical protein [Spongiactinospora sp. 9N601]
MANDLEQCLADIALLALVLKDNPRPERRLYPDVIAAKDHAGPVQVPA